MEDDRGKQRKNGMHSKYRYARKVFVFVTIRGANNRNDEVNMKGSYLLVWLCSGNRIEQCVEFQGTSGSLCLQFGSQKVKYIHSITLAITL